MTESYKAKIYKIVNNVDDKIYIGSTRQPLYKRINQHRVRFRSNYKFQYSSRILFEKYGIENCSIILIEEVDVKNIEEQRRIEREWFEKLKHIAVNLHLPHITKEEISQQNKLYKITNKDKINERLKIRRETQDFKDNQNIRDKKYREAHVDELKDKRRKTFICECGRETTNTHKLRHFKSIIHSKIMNEKETEEISKNHYLNI